MKRIILLATVALILAAMVVAMAMPAFAVAPVAPPPGLVPTKEACKAAFKADDDNGGGLTDQFSNQGQCTKVSEG
jgi:hypothetical protein